MIFRNGKQQFRQSLKVKFFFQRMVGTLKSQAYDFSTRSLFHSKKFHRYKVSPGICGIFLNLVQLPESMEEKVAVELSDQQVLILSSFTSSMISMEEMADFSSSKAYLSEQEFEQLDNRLSKFAFARKVLKIHTIIDAFDIFSIYRNHNKISNNLGKIANQKEKSLGIRSGDSVHQSIELCIDDRDDGWVKARTIYRLLFTLVGLYVTLKFIFLAGLSLVISKLEQKSTLINPSKLSMDLNDKILYLKQIRTSMGDFLAVAPNYSVLVYLYTSSTLLFNLILATIYFDRNPVDAVASRFILNPKREIRKCDLLLEKIITNLLISLKIQKGCELNKGYNLVEIDTLDRIESQFTQTQSLLRHEKSWLRPDFYKLDSYSGQCKFYFKIESYSFIYHITCNLIGWLGIYTISHYNGATLKVDWKLVLILFELQFSGFCVIFFYHGVFVQISLIVDRHSKITGGISKLFNEFRLISYQSNFSTLEQTNLSKISRTEWKSPLISQETNDLLNEDKFDAAILRFIIKYLLYEIELKKSIGHMSAITSWLLVNSIIIIAISVAPSSMENTTSFDLATPVIASGLMVANSVIVLAAFMQKQYLKTVNRSAWKVLALLAIRSLTIPEGYLVSRFRKIIQIVGSQTDHYAIKPFSIALTYRRAMEFSFLTLTVISLSIPQWR